MNPILIVDDEAAIAMLVRRILTEAGYRCQAVTDSRAAANLLEKNRYDLVLLDVMMPKKNGFDVCQEVRADPAFAATRILMLTARGRDTEVAKGLALGADGYMTKPFSTKELVDKVRELLA